MSKGLPHLSLEIVDKGKEQTGNSREIFTQWSNDHLHIEYMTLYGSLTDTLPCNFIACMNIYYIVNILICLCAITETEGGYCQGTPQW